MEALGVADEVEVGFCHSVGVGEEVCKRWRGFNGGVGSAGVSVGPKCSEKDGQLREESKERERNLISKFLYDYSMRE